MGYGCYGISKLKHENMRCNRNQIVLTIICVFGLAGCESRDVFKQALIATAQSNAATKGNSDKIKNVF